MGLCGCECQRPLQMQIPEWVLGVEAGEAAHCFLVLARSRSIFHICLWAIPFPRPGFFQPEWKEISRNK